MKRKMSLVFPQVRNLCYMVTRRERTKHAICKLQEQIFHLQMKLIEQDLCRGRHLSCPLLPVPLSVYTVNVVGPRMGVCLWGLVGPCVSGQGPLPPTHTLHIQLVRQHGPSQGFSFVLVDKETEFGMWYQACTQGVFLVHRGTSM